MVVINESSAKIGEINQTNLTREREKGKGLWEKRRTGETEQAIVTGEGEGKMMGRGLWGRRGRGKQNG